MRASKESDYLLTADFDAKYPGIKPFIRVALRQLVQGGLTREAAEKAFQDYQAFSVSDHGKLSEGGEAFKTALQNLLKNQGI
jgi:hypothetical protein